LQHIRSVEPALEPAIEPQLDHPLEPVAVTRKQLQKRRLVPSLDALPQLARLAGIRRHDATPC
jgi:hypothetical protein